MHDLEVWEADDLAVSWDCGMRAACSYECWGTHRFENPASSRHVTLLLRDQRRPLLHRMALRRRDHQQKRHLRRVDDHLD